VDALRCDRDRAAHPQRQNPVGLGLKNDGTAAEAMQSLEDNHNKVTGMGLVNALCDLHR
jgi:hypothetical protein